MNTLPQELIDRISSYLERDDLRNTLLLSCKLQYAAERYSKAFSDFTFTLDNVAKFLSTYRSYRFSYLRNVYFQLTVPALELDEDGEEWCRDAAKRLKIRDEECTRQINVLFSTLKEVESSVKDIYGSGRIHLTVYTPKKKSCREEYYHRTVTSWRVRLLSPSTLPTLIYVHSFTLETEVTFVEHPNEEGTLSRKLDYRVLVDLAAKFPNLKTLQCRVGGDEWLGCFESPSIIENSEDWPGPRRDSRHDFGKACEGFEGVALQCLRHVQLDFLYPLYWVENLDQRLALPNLVKPALFDPFSSSLRILSYQLRTMSLRVVADETLFWPLDSSTKTPFWPNMESMNVMFHMSAPSGSWYFHGLPGVGATHGFNITTEHYPPLEAIIGDRADDFDNEGEVAECRFRVHPNNETLVPFLSAFARAAACMPLLKEFALWTPLHFDSLWDLEDYDDFDVSTVSQYAVDKIPSDLAWGIAYVAPGEQDFTVWPRGDCSPNRRIWWRVADWRPDAELHDTFQNIGREKHGENLLEYWNDKGITYSYPNGYRKDNCGDGLDYRDWFTEWEGTRWNVDPLDR